MPDEGAMTVEDKLSIALKSLTLIRDAYGHVCETYEVCTHKACWSSYCAWAVADATLNRLGGKLEDKEWARIEKIVEEVRANG